MDYLRHHLGEAVARSRPELAANDQKALVDRIAEFIENHNPHHDPRRMVAVDTDELASRHPNSNEQNISSESRELGFVVACHPDGKITEVILDGLGLGSRLVPGTDYAALVSPFHSRRATRFVRGIRQDHPSFDCALSILARSGMVRLFCSGFAVESQIVIIASEQPLTVSIPRELARLADTKPAVLRPVLKELAAWKKDHKSALPVESVAPTAHDASSAAEIAAERPTAAGRRRLLELAAHDLRNPISGVLAACQYLLEDAGKTLEPHQILILCSIESSTRLALQLIQDLAEIPAIQLGKPQLDLAPADLVEVVRQAAATIRPFASGMNVKLEVGGKQQIPIARVDAAKLGEALHGLLVNAIGGPSMPGRVEIVASLRAGEAIIALHREYAAAAGRSTAPAGPAGPRTSPRKLSDVHAALLLARARRIIKAHGGSIRVETQGKYGNSWTVSLPVAVEQLTHNK